MAAGIITILAALIPFVIFLIKARIANDPQEDYEERVKTAEKDVVKHNSATTTINGINDLAILEHLQQLHNGPKSN